MATSSRRSAERVALAEAQHAARMRRDQELLTELVSLWAPVEQAARRAAWSILSQMPEPAGPGWLDDMGRLRRASAEVASAMAQFTEQAASLINEAVQAEAIIAVADAAALAAAR